MAWWKDDDVAWKEWIFIICLCFFCGALIMWATLSATLSYEKPEDEDLKFERSATLDDVIKELKIIEEKL